MLLFGAFFLILVTIVFQPPIHFLGSSLTFMLVYVWSKRNRDVQVRVHRVRAAQIPQIKCAHQTERCVPP